MAERKHSIGKKILVWIKLTAEEYDNYREIENADISPALIRFFGDDLDFGNDLNELKDLAIEGNLEKYTEKLNNMGKIQALLAKSIIISYTKSKLF